MFWIISTIVCSIATVFVLIDYCIKRFTSYGLAKLAPGPKMYPIIGVLNFLFCGTKLYEVTLKFCKIYPSGFPSWTFGYFIYNSYSAESLEKILTNRKHTDKSMSYKYLQPLLGTGLLTSSGKKWLHRRKLLAPAFYFSVLSGFQATFCEQTTLLIKSIGETETNRPEGTHLQQLISRFTLNTICESAMGVKIKRIDELDEYRSEINRIGKLLVGRTSIPWMAFDWIYNTFGNGKIERKHIKKVHDFTGGIIDKKRKLFQSVNDQTRTASGTDDCDSARKERHAVLDTLLNAEKNGKQIDEKGIQEEVDTFVFGGFDTTMTALTFILFMLANHSDVQQRLYMEIQSLHDTQEYKDLNYLDAVIKESLRLYPPVPFIGRVLGEETVIDNVKLPPKTLIHILIFALHRDPRYFKDPENFEPNRFLDGEMECGQPRHPYAYLPFSASHRNCIGQKFAMMELRTAVTEIIRNFELKPITRVEDVVLVTDIILRSKDPIYIKFVAR